MITANPIPLPANTVSSLTLAAQVFAEWQAGKVVVFDNSGITVDGKKWNHFTLVPPTDGTENPHVFKLHDGKWFVGFDGKETQFKQAVGFKYIHLLLPRKPIPVTQLVNLVNYSGSGPASPNEKGCQFKEGGSFEGLSVQTVSKDPLITAMSREKIIKLLAEYQEELKAQDRAGDFDGAVETEAKIVEIKEYLKASRHKGHDQEFHNRYKRDLDSVRIAINRAIKSIGTANPSLAWHLHLSIKTGAQCVYQTEKPVQWDL